MEIEAKLEKPTVVTGTRQINNLLIKMKNPPAVPPPGNGNLL